MTDTVEIGITIDRPVADVLRITLDRPQVLNALNPEMVIALNETLEAAAADSDCRVIIITGAGRGFCSGQDMAAAAKRNAGKGPSAADKLVGQERFSSIIRRIRAVPQPVIAGVNGVAAGAGMGIALAADIRIASTTARFLVASVRIGVTGGESGLSYHLPRLIGIGRAGEILMTGRPVEAVEAERIGMVNRLVEPAQLEQALLDQAAALLANSPFSITQTKRLMWRNLDAPDLMSALELEDRTQILASMTDDYKEALAAFAEKRPPRFSGR
jgi:enoyl-CoA hydratase